MIRKLLVTGLVVLIGAQVAFPLELRTERRLFINGMENRSEPRYSYLETVLRTALFQEASLVPFITVSEREQELLAEFIRVTASGEGEQDGETPEAPKIPFRMDLQPTLEEPHPGDIPLVIEGDYQVSPGEGSAELLRADFRVTDILTGEIDAVYGFEVPLTEFLNEPRTLVAPLIEQFLPYRSVHLSVTAVPDDSFIYLDEELAGVGTFSGLIPPGTIRVTVRREGYRTFTDLVRINDDRTLEIRLERTERFRTLLVHTSMPGASVYLDNRLQGETPLELQVPPNSSIAVALEGYSTELIPVSEIPEETDSLLIDLRAPQTIQELQERGLKHRKRSSLYSYAGLGLLFVSVILGTQARRYDQLAELSSDPGRVQDALDKRRLYSALTIASSLLTGGAIALSFHHTIRYFNLFERAGTADIETGGNAVGEEQH